jgi:hypothetical protein
MPNFNQINRLMGTGREKFFQAKNGDFDDQLGALLRLVDPYWEDREETEMDVFERQSPLESVVTEDGVEMQPTRTCRRPSQDETGSDKPRIHREIVVSKLISEGAGGVELEVA